MRREQKAFGFDHAQVGAALARSWGLPVELLHSIRFHHAAPKDDLSNPLYDIVHCGDGLAMMLGYGVGYDGLSYSLGPDSKRLLGLDQGRLESLLVKVRLRLREFLTEED